MKELGLRYSSHLKKDLKSTKMKNQYLRNSVRPISCWKVEHPSRAMYSLSIQRFFNKKINKYVNIAVGYNMHNRISKC